MSLTILRRDQVASRNPIRNNQLEFQIGPYSRCARGAIFQRHHGELSSARVVLRCFFTASSFYRTIGNGHRRNYFGAVSCQGWFLLDSIGNEKSRTAGLL